MTTQEHIFQTSESRAYYQRNQEYYRKPFDLIEDPVWKAMPHRMEWGQRIYDIGCAYPGRALALANRLKRCSISCFELSQIPLMEFAFDHWDDPNARKLDLIVGGVGDRYPRADTAILSYVLHWVDPETVERVMAGDGLPQVEIGGILIINDFCPAEPIDVPNKHNPGIITRKRNYPKLWMQSGKYEPVGEYLYTDKHSGEPCSCVAMRKIR